MAAKILSLREQKKIDQWANEIGLTHELGVHRRSYGGSYGPSTIGCGVFLGCGGVLFGLPAAIAQASQLPAAGPLAFGVVAALIALGVVVVRMSPRQKVDWIFLYTGGIVQVIEGEHRPRVIPWALFDHMSKDFDTTPSDSDHPHAHTLKRCRAVGRDGSVIVADGKYGRAVERLAAELDEMVVAVRLPQAIEQFTSGAPVHFGRLTVSHEGLWWDHGDKRFAWKDIRSLRLAPDRIEVDTGGWRMSRRIDLTGMADPHVGLLLIQEMAPSLGVRLQGDPIATPSEPPTAAQVTGAKTVLLSEIDVSEVLGRPVEAAVGVRLGGLHAGVFEGEGVRLSLALMPEGVFSTINRAAGNRFGRVLPGIGDKTWLLNSDRTAIIRAGRATAKLTLTGLPKPARAAVLTALAQIVATRLVTPSDLAPFPHVRPGNGCALAGVGGIS